MKRNNKTRNPIPWNLMLLTLVVVAVCCVATNPCAAAQEQTSKMTHYTIVEPSGERNLTISCNMTGAEMPIKWSVLKVNGSNHELVGGNTEYTQRFDINVPGMNAGDLCLVFVGNEAHQTAHEEEVIKIM